MSDVDRIATMAARLDPDRVGALVSLLTAIAPDPEPTEEERLTAARRAVLNREASPAVGRLDEFAFLRAQGLTVPEVAERMYVHHRTAERYERLLRGAP